MVFLANLLKYGFTTTFNISNNGKILNSILIKHRFYSSEIGIQPDIVDNDVIINEIAKGDPEIENKLKLIMLEIEVTRQSGKRAPEDHSFKIHHYERLLKMNSRSGRQKFLAFLWKNSMSSINKKLKKKESYEEYLKTKMLKTENENNDEMKYSLGHNAMLLRVYDKLMNQTYNHRLLQTMLFGQNLIIDCSYDDYMTIPETVNAANQLTLLFANNRYHPNPFNIHICNCTFNSFFMKQLHRNIPSLLNADFPLNIHYESYTNLFPKKNLVYLTPHCREEIQYNPDDIYIIGCLVDKTNSEPISLAKAKENNLRMGKLPLDKYFQWNSGAGKSLTINQVCDIMLDYNNTHDWNIAFKHIPKRKISEIKGSFNSFASRPKFIYNKNKYDQKNYLIKSNKTSEKPKRSLKIDDLF